MLKLGEIIDKTMTIGNQNYPQYQGIPNKDFAQILLLLKHYHFLACKLDVQ